MDLEFDSLALTINSNGFKVPDFIDYELFSTVKDYLISLLKNSNIEIVHFGYAPDNTADGNDELLNDGTYFRIICEDRYLGIDIDAKKDEVLKAFLFIIENYNPFWSTVIVETGFIKKEVTIELLYKEL